MIIRVWNFFFKDSGSKRKDLWFVRHRVVLEHVSVLLGTEAPPVPAAAAVAAAPAAAATGPAAAATGPPLQSVTLSKGPPIASAAKGHIPPLRVIQLLPRLIRALFCWMQVMTGDACLRH